ncbi:MAG: ATP-binding cassette domain-containing protein [Ideonella sp.]|nr:ATP-binding cassette domain-containing protein [Ideonella sp.]
MIRAEQLGLHVAGRPLLQGLDWQVQPGQRVAVLGHNGAGKSTLLRSLAGFMPVAQGQLSVMGTALHDKPSNSALTALRAQVAQIHQGVHLVGRLSALDNVLIGGAARFTSPMSWLRRWPRTERDAAQAALARVGLGSAAQRRADTLSGGERQKVAMARALHQRARLLLADEPTAALDARAEDEVLTLLDSLVREQGLTLISVVHDLRLLPRLADRVLVLRQGRAVLDAALADVSPETLSEALAHVQ